MKEDKLETSRVTTAVNNPIIKDLIDAGVIPAQCTRFTLEASVKDAITIKSECFATEEQVRMIADALLSNPEAARDIARSIVFRSLEYPEARSVTVEL